MDKYIEALVKYFGIEKEDDNYYSTNSEGEERYYVGTREELEDIMVKTKLNRDEWVEAVEEGYTDAGYNEWVAELKSDIQDLNDYDDEPLSIFDIGDEEIIVIKTV